MRSWILVVCCALASAAPAPAQDDRAVLPDVWKAVSPPTQAAQPEALPDKSPNVQNSAVLIVSDAPRPEEVAQPLAVTVGDASTKPAEAEKVKPSRSDESPKQSEAGPMAAQDMEQGKAADPQPLAGNPPEITAAMNAQEADATNTVEAKNKQPDVSKTDEPNTATVPTPDEPNAPTPTTDKPNAKTDEPNAAATDTASPDAADAPDASKQEFSAQPGGQHGGASDSNDAHGMMLGSPIKPVKSPLGKLKAYVVSMESQKDRLDKFRGAWHKVWPDVQFEVIPAVVADKRGEGVGRSFVKALNKAMSDDVDYGLFFEDDAVPFHHFEWPDQALHILAMAPKDHGMVQLGAHHVATYDSKKPSKEQIKEAEKNGGWTRIRKSFGAYAWGIPRNQMIHLRDLWRDHVSDKSLDHYAIDKAWWKLWEVNPCYLATPLLVDHKPGFSNTWSTERKDPWMGHANWWDYEPAHSD